MRVICIKEHDCPDIGCEHFPRPQVGSEYFVIREGRINGELFYALAGFDYSWAYLAEYFAIISEETADEMAEAEREAIVNLETVIV